MVGVVLVYIVLFRHLSVYLTVRREVSVVCDSYIYIYIYITICPSQGAGGARAPRALCPPCTTLFPMYLLSARGRIK